MSSVLAIAAVTQVLKRILDEALGTSDIASLGTSVSSISPAKIEADGSTNTNLLNVFMYLTTPNQGWRNHAYPSHNASGERISNPPLALDLHYMISCYGLNELDPEMILGAAMQILHDNAVLSRSLIQTYLTQNGPASLLEELSILETSGLAEQLEQIKITPETLNTEELSRLWTAFGAKYQRSAFYKASVVLIEGRKSTRATFPVKEPKVYLQQFLLPNISKISSRSTPEESTIDHQKIFPGYSLVLKGNQLKGQITAVLIGGKEVIENDFSFHSNTEIIFPIPPDLNAGIHGVQVVHKVDMELPPPRKIFSSNVEAFVLSPIIASVTEENITIDGNAHLELQLNINPAIEDKQKVTLLLNETNIDFAIESPKAYSFSLLPGDSNSIWTIPITTKGVKNGDYILRVRVDNTISPVADNYVLEINNNP